MKRIIIALVISVIALTLNSCKSKGCGCPGGAGYKTQNLTIPTNNNQA